MSNSISESLPPPFLGERSDQVYWPVHKKALSLIVATLQSAVLFLRNMSMDKTNIRKKTM